MVYDGVSVGWMYDCTVCGAQFGNHGSPHSTDIQADIQL